MKTLKITVSFDPSVYHYLNKQIVIPAYLARELHVNDGQAGVVSENERVLEVNYRGSLVELPKDRIRVVEGI